MAMQVPDMSKLLKGGYIGDYIGEYYGGVLQGSIIGDIRSVDYSSYNVGPNLRVHRLSEGKPPP